MNSKRAGKTRPFLQHITGRIYEGAVATEAQRSEREAWEASTLPLSYACSVMGHRRGRLPDQYIKRRSAAPAAANTEKPAPRLLLFWRHKPGHGLYVR